MFCRVKRTHVVIGLRSLAPCGWVEMNMKHLARDNGKGDIIDIVPPKMKMVHSAKPFDCPEGRKQVSHSINTAGLLASMKRTASLTSPRPRV